MRWCRRRSESTPVTVKDYLRCVRSLALGHTLLQLQCHWLKITFKRTPLLSPCFRTSRGRGMFVVWFTVYHHQWTAHSEESNIFSLHPQDTFCVSKGHTFWHTTVARAHTHTRTPILCTTCSLRRYISRSFHSVATKQNTWFDTKPSHISHVQFGLSFLFGEKLSKSMVVVDKVSQSQS